MKRYKRNALLVTLVLTPGMWQYGVAQEKQPNITILASDIHTLSNTY